MRYELADVVRYAAIRTSRRTAMITFIHEGQELHKSNVAASLAPAVGDLVKFKGEEQRYKVNEVVFIFNGGVDAEVRVDLPNVV
jgi:hypothetical protein